MSTGLSRPFTKVRDYFWGDAVARVLKIWEGIEGSAVDWDACLG